MTSHMEKVQILQMRRVMVLLVLAALLGLASSSLASATSRGAVVDYAMSFPVDGQVEWGDRYGAPRQGHLHEGQDLFAPKGTPVVAVKPGVVQLVNWSLTDPPEASRCCSIVIDHKDGWQSRYLHLNNDSDGTDDGRGWGVAKGVVPGARVKAGQVIGWVGDSGNAEDTRPHLHFELRDPHGVVVDAYEALRQAVQPEAPKKPESPSTSQLIEVGDSGRAVRTLQRDLRTLGFDPGPVDGDFGPLTNAAVVAFQKTHGLEPDGVVGPLTRGAMDKLLKPLPVVRIGDRRPAVEQLQRLLSDAGVDPGPIDGIFGPATESAVLRFQRQRTLVVDGIVGSQTWGALRGY